MNDKQNGLIGGSFQSGLSALSASGNKAAVCEHPAMPLFREYCDVKAEFDENCRNLSAYQQRKADSEKCLAELSAKIQAVVEDGQYDPTNPRPANPRPDQRSHPAY